MEFVDGVLHKHNQMDIQPPTNSSFQVSPADRLYTSINALLRMTPRVKRFHFLQTLTYDTPKGFGVFTTDVLLKVANETLPCSAITYHPDPEFSSFTTLKTTDGVRITIQVTGPIS